MIKKLCSPAVNILPATTRTDKKQEQQKHKIILQDGFLDYAFPTRVLQQKKVSRKIMSIWLIF
jgi:hypothetical protein